VGEQRVFPLRECLEWYLDNSYLPPLRNDDRALLERWREHPDAEKIWNTIRAHSEHHSGPIGINAANHFIRFILTMKYQAERESELNAKSVVIAEVKKAEAEFRRKLVQNVREMPDHVLPEFLEETGKRLRQRRPEETSPVISHSRVRSDKNGSRARTYFIREVSGFIHDISGRWLDGEVATITGIAFDMDISDDAVRRARSENKAALP
jgi:hypothetical protein